MNNIADLASLIARIKEIKVGKENPVNASGLPANGESFESTLRKFLEAFENDKTQDKLEVQNQSKSNQRPVAGVSGSASTVDEANPEKPATDVNRTDLESFSNNPAAEKEARDQTGPATEPTSEDDNFSTQQVFEKLYTKAETKNVADFERSLYERNVLEFAKILKFDLSDGTGSEQLGSAAGENQAPIRGDLDLRSEDSPEETASKVLSEEIPEERQYEKGLPLSRSSDSNDPVHEDEHHVEFPKGSKGSQEGNQIITEDRGISRKLEASRHLLNTEGEPEARFARQSRVTASETYALQAKSRQVNATNEGTLKRKSEVGRYPLNVEGNSEFRASETKAEIHVTVHENPSVEERTVGRAVSNSSTRPSTGSETKVGVERRESLSVSDSTYRASANRQLVAESHQVEASLSSLKTSVTAHENPSIEERTVGRAVSSNSTNPLTGSETKVGVERRESLPVSDSTYRASANRQLVAGSYQAEKPLSSSKTSVTAQENPSIEERTVERAVSSNSTSPSTGNETKVGVERRESLSVSDSTYRAPANRLLVAESYQVDKPLSSPKTSMIAQRGERSFGEKQSANEGTVSSRVSLSNTNGSAIVQEIKYGTNQAHKTITNPPTETATGEVLNGGEEPGNSNELVNRKAEVTSRITGKPGSDPIAERGVTFDSASHISRSERFARTSSDGPIFSQVPSGDTKGNHRREVASSLVREDAQAVSEGQTAKNLRQPLASELKKDNMDIPTGEFDELKEKAKNLPQAEHNQPERLNWSKGKSIDIEERDQFAPLRSEGPKVKTREAVAESKAPKFLVGGIREKVENVEKGTSKPSFENVRMEENFDELAERANLKSVTFVKEHSGVGTAPKDVSEINKSQAQLHSDNELKTPTIYHDVRDVANRAKALHNAKTHGEEALSYQSDSLASNIGAERASSREIGKEVIDATQQARSDTILTSSKRSTSSFGTQSSEGIQKEPLLKEASERTSKLVDTTSKVTASKLQSVDDAITDQTFSKTPASFHHDVRDVANRAKALHNAKTHGEESLSYQSDSLVSNIGAERSSSREIGKEVIDATQQARSDTILTSSKRSTSSFGTQSSEGIQKEPLLKEASERTSKLVDTTSKVTASKLQSVDDAITDQTFSKTPTSFHHDIRDVANRAKALHDAKTHGEEALSYQSDSLVSNIGAERASSRDIGKEVKETTQHLTSSKRTTSSFGTKSLEGIQMETLLKDASERTPKLVDATPKVTASKLRSVDDAIIDQTFSGTFSSLSQAIVSMVATFNTMGPVLGQVLPTIGGQREKTELADRSAERLSEELKAFVEAVRRVASESVLRIFGRSANSEKKSSEEAQAELKTELPSKNFFARALAQPVSEQVLQGNVAQSVTSTGERNVTHESNLNASSYVSRTSDYANQHRTLEYDLRPHDAPNVDSQVRNGTEDPSKNIVELKDFQHKTESAGVAGGSDAGARNPSESPDQRPRVSEKFVERLAEQAYKFQGNGSTNFAEGVVRDASLELAERLQYSRNLEQIYQRIREFLASNSSRETIFMKLQPEYLGELEVQLRRQGNILQVTFAAETEKAKELLEKNAHVLREKLTLLDFEIRTIEVKVKDEKLYDEDRRHGQPRQDGGKQGWNHGREGEQERREERENRWKRWVMSDDDERQGSI